MSGPSPAGVTAAPPAPATPSGAMRAAAAQDPVTLSGAGSAAAAQEQATPAGTMRAAAAHAPQPPAAPHAPAAPSGGGLAPAPPAPSLLLGDRHTWLRIERAAADDRTRKDTWHLAASRRDGELSARFTTAPLARRDLHAFATTLRAGIAAGAPFSLSLAEEDRHNPLRLHALPAGARGHGFHLRLTPHGQDTANHLDMEIAPVATEALLAALDTFLRTLV
ncbi:hypothetical protein [Streptomyces sp. NPDC058657]|uniref:hypothetical protein n=1 Tax=unclassified Streptomyces TaxID=2593676 RepID=UPI00365C5354